MAQAQIKQNNALSFIQRNAVSVGAILVVLMLIVPMHSVLLDIFMAMNLSISVLLLLTVISPYDLSANNFACHPFWAWHKRFFD